MYARTPSWKSAPSASLQVCKFLSLFSSFFCSFESYLVDVYTSLFSQIESRCNMFYSMIRCYGTRIHLVGIGLVILITELADGMESPSASLAMDKTIGF